MSNVTAVNNNGVVAGSIKSGANNGCLQQGYLWNSNDNTFMIINPLEVPNYSTSGFRLSVLSTDLISGGITFTSNNSELATENNFLTPSNSIIKWNYVFGISENGQYITGTTPYGSYLFFDTKQQQQIDLSYNPPLTLAQHTAELISVANNGIAVGSIIESNISRALICDATSKSCNAVAGGIDNNYKAWASSISANGKFIYGYALSLDNTSSQIFSVDVTTHAIKPLFESYFITNSITTNDGVIIVVNLRSNELAFYNQATNHLYSVQDLAQQLHLPDNVDISTASLSPNGHFLVFDVSDYRYNTFAVRVFFPQGVARYVENNLVAIPQPAQRAAWFR